MLTGESVPISKTALQRSRLTSYNSSSSLKDDEKFYDAKEHSKHTLFRGTKVIQTRNHRDMDTVAIVIRTGISELKLHYSVSHRTACSICFNCVKRIHLSIYLQAFQRRKEILFVQFYIHHRLISNSSRILTDS